ncbi:MAG: hypothetical protein M3N05_00065 [Pseudomonadota bacterium]|nr:hypothetical protein [Pseudomonadota bacterium]
MKRLLIATAALGLLTAGVAFAQDSQSGIGAPGSTAGQPAPATMPMPAKPTDAVKSPAITPQSTGTPAPAIVDTGTGSAPPAAAPATPPMAATKSPATGEVVGDMSTANPPPAAGAYPRCTHKGQDRCTTMAQSHRRTKKSAAGA